MIQYDVIFYFRFGFVSGHLYSRRESCFSRVNIPVPLLSLTSSPNIKLPAKQNRQMCCLVSNFLSSPSGNIPLHATIFYDTNFLDYMFRPNSRPASGLIKERVPHWLELRVFKGAGLSLSVCLM